MSCRTTPAGSAWTTFARLESGLTDVQTLSAYHALRAEGEGVPAPTQAEWNTFLAAQRIEMEAAGFTAARVRSIGGRMDRAAEQLPDGRTWYALRNIRDRAAGEANRVMADIAQMSQISGLSVADLTNRYQERLRTVERGRSVEAPEGYAEARTAWRSAGLPADHGTYAVLSQMRAEALAARNDSAPVRRIEHVVFPNSRAIYAAGYDPTDGRLEVVFRRRNRDGETTGTSRTYAYHSIPAEVWAEMNNDQGGAGLVYNRRVRNHSEYRYASTEAEEAAASARCEECGQWRAAAHTCPPVAPAPEQAAQPDPVIVSTSRDGRRRIVSVVPADYVTPLPTSNEDASTEVPVGRERTPAEHAAVGAEVNRILDEIAAQDATAEAALEAEVEAAFRDYVAEGALTPEEMAMLAAEDASREADLADQAYEQAHETETAAAVARLRAASDRIGFTTPDVEMELDDSYYSADDSYDTKPFVEGLDGATAPATTDLLARLNAVGASPDVNAGDVAHRPSAQPVADDSARHDAALSDLRARIAGRSTSSSASARIAAAIPDPVTAESLGIALTTQPRFGHLTERERDAITYDDGHYDVMRLPATHALGHAYHQAARTPVILPVNWSLGRHTQPDGTSRYTNHLVRGEVIYSRLSGQETFSGRNLQCTCTDYQSRYDCPHVREVVSVYATAITTRTAGLTRGINADQPPLPDDARRQAVPTTIGRRFDRRRAANRSTGWPERDTLHAPTRAADARAAAADNPIVLPVEWSGERRTAGPDGLPVGQFEVTGEMVYSRPGRGQHEFTGRDLRCTCPQYREEYRCPHVDAVANVYRQRIMPASSTPTPTTTDTTTSTAVSGVNADEIGMVGVEAPMTATEIALAQRAAERALREDWTRQQTTAAEARARHQAASDPADSYADNFDAFAADHAAALARKAAGEPVIPLMTSNVLNGEFTRESGRGFGVEIEFDFPPGIDRAAALRAIGRELYAAGLTRTAHQQEYHAAEERGYVDVHERGWSFEEDGTVAGEIVSPIMYDEPKTWETLPLVAEIVKRNGGIASIKTGSHVHVSAPHMTPQVATELMHSTNVHEDLLYRLSQNPERTEHRPMKWCGPNDDVPQGGYTNMESQVQYVGWLHRNGVNLNGVHGSASDHPEMRYWDGTLDPAAIQAQIKMSCAMVLAAERNAGLTRTHAVRESLGSHHTRMKATLAGTRRRLTSDELREDTATFRSFVDTMFTRREDKAQVAALFAITSWQRPTLANSSSF